MPPIEPGLVSIIVVTWNSAATLRECLRAVNAQTYQPIEIVIVDNASSDESLAIVGEVAPGATVIRNATNTGFCVGQNMGIAASRGEFVMPLNPDTHMAPAFVAEMVRGMQADERVGTVCGKLLLPEADAASGQRLIDSTGLFVTPARRQVLRGYGVPDRGQYETPDYVFGACGAAPLYRRAMLDDVQIDGDVFDRVFFAHKEDFDLAWRAQVLGWRAWYQPSAVIEHDRSFRPATRHVRDLMTDDVRAHAVKNRYLTIVKNDLWPNVLRNLPAIMWYDVKILGYIVLFERSSLRGVAQFVRLLPDALRKRRAIMRRRQASSAYMAQFFAQKV